MATKRRRRLRVKPIIEEEPVVEEIEEPNDDEETIRQARRILTATEDVDDVGPTEEIIKPEPLPPAGKVMFSTDPVTDVLNDLEEGHAVVITREDAERFSMRVLETNEFSVKPMMSWPEYFQTVYSEEYLAWKIDWDSMSMDEKVAEAVKLDVVWEQHNVHRVNAMRMAAAVRETLGMTTKYKPEWDNKGKRNNIRPKKR